MDSNNRLSALWLGLAQLTRYKSYVVQADLDQFARRMDSEGEEFYARQLSRLSADLLAGLESGRLVVTARFGLKRRTSLPRFLHNAWLSVFSEDGQLLPNVIPSAVDCLRQLTAVFGKIEGAHTPESEIEMLDRFVAVESRMRSTRLFTRNDRAKVLYGHTTLSDLLTRARKLVLRVLSGVSPQDITPKHGSGVSACGTPKWARYGPPRYCGRLDRTWDYSTYFMPTSATFYGDHADEIMGLEEFEPVAKVLLVPKDYRGPRIISCEPRETMWIQQGLMASMYGVIEQHPLTRGSVKFTDQSYNREAALKGSANCLTATLDLKEASDRVRMSLVKALFPSNWYSALAACRSRYTELPDGRRVRMHKHAPMGSATCFPVMALCIWSVLAASLPQRDRKDLLVYGDDVVIGSVHVDRAIKCLEAVGLMVNRDKSFVQGPFRESCGIEAIHGVDVTPVRLRKRPTNDGVGRASTISFANNLFAKFGCEQWNVSQWIPYWYRDIPELEVKHIGRIQDDIPVLSTVLLVSDAENHHLKRRWNTDLQRFEFRFPVPVTQGVKYPVDCWSQVFRALVNPDPKRALGYDPLPKRVAYKYRWTSLAL